MKVLILGITGMLGHKLCQVLSSRFDVIGTLRPDYVGIDTLKKYSIYNKTEIKYGVDARNIASVENVIIEVEPDFIVNCIGIIKNIPEGKNTELNIIVNALFPHQLYDICIKRTIKLIHISTDCVFSGGKGNYTEKDLADAVDVYGKTKFLGELSNALTIRTSLIGRELFERTGLIEWFLANSGNKVQGYENAIFSGFTTLEFSHIISDIITKYRDLKGIYNISADPISKYDLLMLLRNKLNLNIEIEKSNLPYCDRSLNSKAFRDLTGLVPLPWNKMIDQFVDDLRKYDEIYKKKGRV